MNVTVVIDPRGHAEVQAVADRAVRNVAEAIEGDAQRYVPVDTGELLASIHTEHGTGSSKVWVGTDHWAPTEYGSRPHTISARAGGALSWPGASHPVRSVNHPGTPAQPFMRPALYQPRAIRA